MVSVDLTTVVWLEAGGGAVNSDGHLVMQPDWQAFAFPGVHFAMGKSYKVEVTYKDGGQSEGYVEVDMYSLTTADAAGYDNSDMNDYAYAYYDTGTVGGSLNASITGIGSGTFTAYLTAGVEDFYAAVRDGEHNVLWYAYDKTITSISYAEIALERSEYIDDLGEETVTFGTTDARSQDTWDTEGVVHQITYGAVGGGYPPLPLSELTTAMEVVNDWPPVQVEPGSFRPSGRAFGVYWGVGFVGSINTEPWTEWYVKHHFMPRTFSVGRSFGPTWPWPENVIGYEWESGGDEYGGGYGYYAYGECTSLRLKTDTTTATTLDMSDSMDGTVGAVPPFTTEVLVGPVTLGSNYSKIPTTPPDDFTPLGSYSYPGGGTSQIYTAIPVTFGGDVDLRPLVRTTSNNRLEGMFITRTTAAGPAGAITASLFGAPEYKAGAFLKSAQLTGTFKAPRYRWIYKEPAPPPLTISAGPAQSRREFT